MSDFKILFKRGPEGAPSRWQEGCPLLIEAWQITKNISTGETWLQMRVCNVFSQPITNASIEFEGTDHNGKKEKQVLKLPETELYSGFSFEFHPTLLDNEIKEANAYVENVTLKDGNTWTSTDEIHLVPVERKQVSLDGQQKEARAKLLDDAGCTKSNRAINFQFESHQDWWLCACGQLNLCTERCISCSIPKQESGAFEDQKQLEEAYEKIKEEKSERSKKHTRTAAIAIAAVLVCGLLIVGIWSVTHSLSTRSILNLEYLTNLSHDQAISYLKGKSSTVSESENVVKAWIKDDESNLNNEGTIDPKTVFYTLSENSHSMLYFAAKGETYSSLDDIHRAVIERSGLSNQFFSGSDTDAGTYYYKDTTRYLLTVGRCKVNNEDAAWYVCSSGKTSGYGSSSSSLKDNANITIIVAKLDDTGGYSSYESIEKKLSQLNNNSLLRYFDGFELNKSLK